MISQGEKFPVLRLPLFVILVISTFLFFGGVPQNQAPFEKVPFSPVVYYVVYFSVAGMLLLALWWFCSMVYRGRIVFQRTPLDIPIILLLIYVAVWIPFSTSTYLVNTEFLKLLVLAGFFYFTVNNIRTKTQANFLVFSIIAATFLISVYGLVNTAILKNETVLGLQRHAGYEQRISATYICPNHFAGLLEMIIPFAISYVIMSRLRIAGKLIIGIMGLVMVTAMVLTLSRGGWAALCAGMATVGLLSICKVRVPLVAVIAPAIVTTALLVFIVANTPTLHDRVTELIQEEETSYTTRKDAWLDTAEVVKHKFLLGSGPGTYEYVITRYQRPGFFSRIDYAHNDYLQTLAEYGLIGLGIVILMIVVIARTCRRMMDNLRDHDDFACVSGFLGAFVAVGVHSFVDFNMHIPGNAILMMVLVGTLFSVRRYSLNRGREFTLLDFRLLPKSNLLLRVPAVLIVTLLVSVGLLITVRRYLGDYYHHTAHQSDISIFKPVSERVEASEEEKQKVINNYLIAHKFDPGNPAHAGALANVYLRQCTSQRTFVRRGAFRVKDFDKLIKEFDPGETFENIKKAVHYGEKAVRANPLFGNYHLNLARAYDILGIWIAESAKSGFLDKVDTTGMKTEEAYTKHARYHFETAILQHPNLPYYHEALAEFYLRHREYGPARKSALKTIELLESLGDWSTLKATDVLVEVAEFYFMQGNYKLAKEVANEAIEQISAIRKFRKKRVMNLLEEIEKKLAELETKGAGAIGD